MREIKKWVLEMVEVMNHEIRNPNSETWKLKGIRGHDDKILYLNFAHDTKYKERSRMSP